MVANIKITADYMWICHAVSDLAQSTVTEPGVGVEKQQNFARCTLGGSVHLNRPSCTRMNDPGMT